MSRTFHASGKRPCGAPAAQRKFCIGLRNRTAQNEDGIEMRGDESSQERACGRLQCLIEIAARPCRPPPQDSTRNYLEQHQCQQRWLDEPGPIPFSQRDHHRLVELGAKQGARVV